MRKILILVAMALMLSMNVFAQEPKGEVIHVTVDGMVCDFCAQSLKKVFMKEDAAQSIDVSLEKKLVTLTLKPGKQFTDAQINTFIDWAGYKVEGIHRVKAGT